MAFSPDTLEAKTAALRAVARLELDPAGAIDVQLALLLTFTGAEFVSLWALAADGRLTVVGQAGEPLAGSAEALRIARAMLSERGPGVVAQDGALGVRIEATQRHDAALIADGLDPTETRHQELLTAAAPILGALFSTRLRSAAPPDPGPRATPPPDTDPPLTAAERLLARLRFDLHDGPQQNVYLLTQDLLLFRDQLRPVIEDSADEARVLGRLDDLEAQVIAVDAGLRRLSTSAQSPFQFRARSRTSSTSSSRRSRSGRASPPGRRRLAIWAG
ncbi:MAG TPA: hypothetical protein VG371_09940 [Solirubrobacteraceae bacterium]|nr:hypothetical protein [Solirubrobacteraceae bacterium]